MTDKLMGCHTTEIDLDRCYAVFEKAEVSSGEDRLHSSPDMSVRESLLIVLSTEQAIPGYYFFSIFRRYIQESGTGFYLLHRRIILQRFSIPTRTNAKTTKRINHQNLIHITISV
jgi:hypothetical protein